MDPHQMDPHQMDIFTRKPTKHSLKDGREFYLLPLATRDVIAINENSDNNVVQAAISVERTVCDADGALLFADVDTVLNNVPFAVVMEIADIVGDTIIALDVSDPLSD